MGSGICPLEQRGCRFPAVSKPRSPPCAGAAASRAGRAAADPQRAGEGAPGPHGRECPLEWGLGWAWGVWGHELCVHLSTAEHLLTLAGRKSSQGGRGGAEEGRGGGTEEEGVLQHAALWGLHAEGGTPPRGAVMEPLLLLGRVWPRTDLTHVTLWGLQAGEGRELLLGQGLQGRRELRAAPSSALQMCSSSLASGTGMGTRTRCLVLYCQNVLKDLMCFLSSKS